MMNFTPNVKPKRYRSKVINAKPFPQKSEGKFRGIFTGLSVEVEDHDSIDCLYRNGCYGKGSHSRGAPRLLQHTSEPTPAGQFQETLVLDLEEALFLVQTLQVLEILDLRGRSIEPKQLCVKFEAIKPNFIYTFVAYIYLKSKNWIIRSGTKFGGDFLIYKQGMRFYHASFIVMVGIESCRKSKDIQGAQRVAETSDKDVLFLDIYPPIGISRSGYYNHLNQFSITETIPKRFDFKKFVQNKQFAP